MNVVGTDVQKLKKKIKKIKIGCSRSCFALGCIVYPNKKTNEYEWIWMVSLKKSKQTAVQKTV